MAFGGIFTKAYQSVRLKKRDYDPELLSIEDIELPFIFKSLDENRIQRDIKSELETYKSVGYRLSSNKNIDKNEYSIYQIGILLVALKKELDLKIIVAKSYLPEFIYKTSEDNMKLKISDILKKYDKEVKKDILEGNAREEYTWTPKEAGYILYFLSMYKKIAK